MHADVCAVTRVRATVSAYSPCMDESAAFTPFCPRYHHAIEVIGRRWTGAILRALLAGHTRFTDIAQTVPGLSDRLLSERLKELEAEEIVVRTVHPETPVRVEYRLTARGEALTPVVQALAEWSERWLPAPASRR